MYTDAYKTGNYAGSLEHLIWLHENAPDLNPSIYINGRPLTGPRNFDSMKKQIELHLN